MIDRAALEQVAGRHLEALQQVYPGEDELKDEMPRDASGASIFDRRVLAYPQIAYLTITAREPENRSTIGFHSSWTEKKPSA